MNLPPPPMPGMLLRGINHYPWYSILRDNVANPRVPLDLEMDFLRNLAQRLNLYLRAHPDNQVLTYDQLVNLNENGQLGGAKKRKSKKSSKKVSKKKSSKKSANLVGGAKKRKSKKSSKKTSKKSSKKTSKK